MPPLEFVEKLVGDGRLSMFSDNKFLGEPPAELDISSAKEPNGFGSLSVNLLFYSPSNWETCKVYVNALLS